MMKTLLYTGIFLLILSSCTSKTTDKSESDRNDSIKKYLDLVGSVTLSFDKRIQYNDKALSLINWNRNDSIVRYQLSYISYKYAFFVKNDKLKSTANKLMELSLKSKDSLNIARANRNLGLYYMAVSDNQKAIEYFFKAKKIFRSIKRMDYVIKVMDNIASTQYYASDFLGSNKTSIEQLLLAEKVNYTKINRKGLINIADNLSALTNDVEAIKYYKKAQKEKTEDNLRWESFNSIALSFINLKQYDSATKYVKINLNNKKLVELNPTSYSRAISLNALIKFRTNHHCNLEREFNLADKYFKKYKSQYGRNYNQIFFSMYYAKMKDTISAIKCAKNALQLSKSYNNLSDVINSLAQLIVVDKKHASENALEYINIQNRMQVAERKFRDAFSRIEYETDKIKQEKETAIKQKWVISGVLSVVILVIALLLIITKQRVRQKELQLLQSQQKANEEIYDLMLLQKTKEEEARQSEKKRIALELHDGVMNKLASTRLNLDVLHHKKDDKTIKECLSYIDDIYMIEQEIRNISHDLTVETFINYNSFTVLINDFVITQNKSSKCHYKLEMDYSIKWQTIPSNIKMNLFRIIQESSHNINKFARAKNAIISFVVDDKNLCLSITDDGIGFDTEQLNEGIGLKNIKQRVELLNGKFILQSSKGKNTSLNIAIPIQ